MKKSKSFTAVGDSGSYKGRRNTGHGRICRQRQPRGLSKALEKRFLETGSPRDLTYMYAAGQGNRDGSASDHFAHEGMLKRVIAGHWNMAPRLGQLAMDNKIEAYNIPQGVICHMYRDIAAHRVGTVTHVGLHTFADPRIEGCKLNERTTEDIVEVINILGEERLIFKTRPIDVVFFKSYKRRRKRKHLHGKGGLPC